ncbi:hybrid sensor histidine kinase/response regulator [Arcobacteraceae bacterium]|nr:hybrid sensor histidine kinase/response regulator [Arcobacteraceae bacterium]
MINNKKFTILIIDNNKDFNNKLSSKIEEYKFKTVQIFEESEIINCIKSSNVIFDLILLNIDFDDTTSTKIFEYITEQTVSKVILLSSEDIGEKREVYFSQGILDYHLTSQKVNHIVDDIVETIYSLYSNKKETILIIDKSEELRQNLEKILKQRNYNVLSTCSAKDGLELLKADTISLLVLDMEITDINALDLLEGLRDMYMFNKFSVLALSENKNPSIVRDTLKRGAKDFLMKPYLYEEFLLKIDILVHSSRQRIINIEQKQEIENNLKRFKELLDSSIGGMFIFENNICINCNNEAVNILGKESKETILQKQIFDIFTDISQKHKEELLEDTVDHNFEDTIISDDGSVYDVQIKERNILLENKILKIIAILDITDVKKHEKVLSEQTKMASMGEMIGNIAHQWRQPLTAISVAAGGIKIDYELDIVNKDDVIVELDNIVENTSFLSTTIESFQNFLKTDKLITKVNIEDTCKKTLAIINANLKAHNIKILQEYSSINPVIKGIENEVVQVFLNIINNATDVLKTLDVNYPRYIKLSIVNNEEYLIVTIHDNGQGIPKEILAKIFDPYFTTKHQSQGTGLGLFMTHNILKNMGAKIDVINKDFIIDSIDYYGASFSIYFPIYKL